MHRGIARTVGMVSGLLLVLAGAGPAAAEDDGTASISGQVTVPDGYVVADVGVSASSTDGVDGGDVTVGVDGSYQITGLLAGSYRVEFTAFGTELLSQYWSGATDWSSATLVVVADGAAVTGINATMVVGGSVSGTVTADGLPVEGAQVWVSGPGSGGASTAPDGTYRVAGLVAGDYTVTFQPPEGSNLVPELWDDRSAAADADLVPVAVATEVTGVDADLAAGGTITGRVLDGLGAPVAFAEVTAFRPDSDGAEYAWDSSTALTAADGTYAITGVADVPVLVTAAGDGSVVRQYWPGVLSASDAETVQVAAGQTRTDVDLTLPAAGHIVGTIALPGGLDFACVRADDGTGVGATSCQEAGQPFDLGGLPEGEYLVWIGDREPGAMMPAWYYAGTSRLSDVSWVPVGPAETVTIDFDATGAFVRGSGEPQVELTLDPPVPAIGEPANVRVEVIGSPVPTGVVELYLDGRWQDDAVLEDGVAYLPSVFDAGADGATLAVRYLGDAEFAEGYADLVLDVARATTTALTTSANPVIQGRELTLTATVSADVGVPSGEVSFLDGVEPLGTVALVGGVATLAVTDLTPGAHELSAVYAGSDDHLASDAAIDQVVLAPPVPRVATISAVAGSRLGGTVVTLRGSGFTGTAAVTFDGVAGTALVVVSDREVQVTTPPGAVGPAVVALSTVSGESRAVEFVYLPVRTRWV